MSLFSPNLTSFIIKTNDAIQYSAMVPFAGFSYHNTLNIRTDPIFDSHSCQAGTQARSVQWSRFGMVGTGGITFSDIVDVGEYHFTWSFEDNTWKIKTYEYNDRMSYYTDDFLSAVPYLLSANVPKSCAVAVLPNTNTNNVGLFSQAAKLAAK